MPWVFIFTVSFELLVSQVNMKHVGEVVTSLKWCKWEWSVLKWKVDPVPTYSVMVLGVMSHDHSFWGFHYYYHVSNDWAKTIVIKTWGPQSLEEEIKGHHLRLIGSKVLKPQTTNDFITQKASDFSVTATHRPVSKVMFFIFLLGDLFLSLWLWGPCVSVWCSLPGS